MRRPGMTAGVFLSFALADFLLGCGASPSDRSATFSPEPVVERGPEPPFPEPATRGVLEVQAEQLPPLEAPCEAEALASWIDVMEPILRRASVLRRNVRPREDANAIYAAAIHARHLKTASRSLRECAMTLPRAPEAETEALIRLADGFEERADRAYAVCQERAVERGVAFDIWQVWCAQRSAEEESSHE